MIILHLEKGQCVTVDDPNKRGKEYKILVHDARGLEKAVPSKYLDK